MTQIEKSYSMLGTSSTWWISTKISRSLPESTAYTRLASRMISISSRTTTGALRFLTIKVGSNTFYCSSILMKTMEMMIIELVERN